MAYKLPKDKKKQLVDGRSIVRQLRNMEASDIEIKKDLKLRGFSEDRIDLIFDSLLIDDLKLVTKGKFNQAILRKINSELKWIGFSMGKIEKILNKINSVKE